jgi:hypothetical protein
VKVHFSLVAASMAATTLLGCRGDDEITKVPTRTSYTFEGSVDPKFVGEWQTQPAPAALTLRKDGSDEMVVVAVAPRHTSSHKVEGQWLVSGTDLLLKYSEKAGGATTLKYKTTLSGNTLNLVDAASGVKLTYHRKSK